jgi:hypothetical protein
MKNIIIQQLLTAIPLTIIASVLTNGAQSPNQPSIRFQSFLRPGYNAARVDTVGNAINFQNWPQPESRHVGFAIDKSLLSLPDLVTRDSFSYSNVQFDQAVWGRFEWSCQCLVKTGEPLPAGLPPERKSHLLERMNPEKRNDPNFVEEYLKRKLDRHRKSKEYRSNGEIDLEVSLAPSSRAAQEYLLAMMTVSTMPTEGLVSTYTYAKRPKELGTVSFLTESTKKDDIRLIFVRDNIFVKVWGNGCFAEDALPLAQKIDALIQKQPVLSYQQLLARRPLIMIGANATKSKMTLETTTSYNVTAPAGQKIVDIKAYIDDQSAPVRDGKIHIINKQGKVKVKIVATTSELLTSTFEKEVTIPE